MSSERLAFSIEQKKNSKADFSQAHLTDDTWMVKENCKPPAANEPSEQNALPIFELAQNTAPQHATKARTLNNNAPVRYEQIMNQETILATLKNEQCQRRTILGIDLDNIKDRIAENLGGDFDIGPAKMSAKQIKELKSDLRYNHNLSNINNLSEDGAKKLIDAYFRREMDRLNNGDYRANNPTKFNEDRPRDVNHKIIRGNFNSAQQLWDRAKLERDADTMRKILIETYNAGKRTDQIIEVECIRTGDKNVHHVDISKWAKQ